MLCTGGLFIPLCWLVGTEIFLFRLPAEQLPGRRPAAAERETCVLSCWHNHSGCCRVEQGLCNSVLFDWAADDSSCCLAVAHCVIKSFLLCSSGSLTEGPLTVKWEKSLWSSNITQRHPLRPWQEPTLTAETELPRLPWTTDPHLSPTVSQSLLDLSPRATPRLHLGWGGSPLCWRTHPDAQRSTLVPRAKSSPTALLTPPLPPPTLQREILSRAKDLWTKDKGQYIICQHPILSLPPLPQLPPTDTQGLQLWRDSALHLHSFPLRDSVTSRRSLFRMKTQTGKLSLFTQNVLSIALSEVRVQWLKLLHWSCLYAAFTKELIEGPCICRISMWVLSSRSKLEGFSTFL